MTLPHRGTFSKEYYGRNIHRMIFDIFYLMVCYCLLTVIINSPCIVRNSIKEDLFNYFVYITTHVLREFQVPNLLYRSLIVDTLTV